jgi:hypothetical protein
LKLEHYKIEVGDYLSNGKVVIMITEKPNKKEFRSIIKYALHPANNILVGDDYTGMYCSNSSYSWKKLNKQDIVKLELKKGV